MSLEDEFERYLEDEPLRDDGPWDVPLQDDPSDAMLTREDVEQIARESSDELSRRGILGWVLELLPPDEKLPLDHPDLIAAAHKINALPSDRRHRGA